MQVKTTEDLGLIIREQRRKQQLDQQELADRVGVSRQWIVAIEKGKPRAEMDLVLRTLRALGLKLDVEIGQERQVGFKPLGIDIDAVINKARGRPR